MSVCVEYVEGGILFSGHFLDWQGSADEIRAIANDLAPQIRCQPSTIERILRFELSLGGLKPQASGGTY